MMFAVCAVATATAWSPARAQVATTCNCQAAIHCGADECYPADDAYCTNSSISFAIEPPAINFCIGEDCMAGPAMLSRPREDEIWLHGSFGHTAAPDRNPTFVTLLFDQTTGIGMIQASDEQGVDQVSLICDVGARE
jgi:hypothetical protein